MDVTTPVVTKDNCSRTNTLPVKQEHSLVLGRKKNQLCYLPAESTITAAWKSDVVIASQVPDGMSLHLLLFWIRIK